MARRVRSGSTSSTASNLSSSAADSCCSSSSSDSDANPTRVQWGPQRTPEKNWLRRVKKKDSREFVRRQSLGWDRSLRDRLESDQDDSSSGDEPDAAGSSDDHPVDAASQVNTSLTDQEDSPGPDSQGTQVPLLSTSVTTRRSSRTSPARLSFPRQDDTDSSDPDNYEGVFRPSLKVAPLLRSSPPVVKEEPVELAISQEGVSLVDEPAAPSTPMFPTRASPAPCSPLSLAAPTSAAPTCSLSQVKEEVMDELDAIPLAPAPAVPGAPTPPDDAIADGSEPLAEATSFDHELRQAKLAADAASESSELSSLHSKGILEPTIAPEQPEDDEPSLPAVPAGDQPDKDTEADFALVPEPLPLEEVKEHLLGQEELGQDAGPAPETSVAEAQPTDDAEDALEPVFIVHDAHDAVIAKNSVDAVELTPAQVQIKVEEASVAIPLPQEEAPVALIVKQEALEMNIDDVSTVSAAEVTVDEATPPEAASESLIKDTASGQAKTEERIVDVEPAFSVVDEPVTLASTCSAVDGEADESEESPVVELPPIVTEAPVVDEPTPIEGPSLDEGLSAAEGAPTVDTTVPEGPQNSAREASLSTQRDDATESSPCAVAEPTFGGDPVAVEESTLVVAAALLGQEGPADVEDAKLEEFAADVEVDEETLSPRVADDGGAPQPLQPAQILVAEATAAEDDVASSAGSTPVEADALEIVVEASEHLPAALATLEVEHFDPSPEVASNESPSPATQDTPSCAAQEGALQRVEDSPLAGASVVHEPQEAPPTPVVSTSHPSPVRITPAVPSIPAAPTDTPLAVPAPQSQALVDPPSVVRFAPRAATQPIASSSRLTSTRSLSPRSESASSTMSTPPASRKASKPPSAEKAPIVRSIRSRIAKAKTDPSESQIARPAYPVSSSSSITRKETVLPSPITRPLRTTKESAIPSPISRPLRTARIVPPSSRLHPDESTTATMEKRRPLRPTVAVQTPVAPEAGPVPPPPAPKRKPLAPTVPADQTLLSTRAPRARKPVNAPPPAPAVAQISDAKLQSITQLNTRNNQAYFSPMEKIVVRKEGENRPESPGPKVKKALPKSSLGKGRALFDPPPAEGEEEDDSEADRPMPTKHVRGPGDLEDYESPMKLPRSALKGFKAKSVKGLVPPGVDPASESISAGYSVRWNKGLVLIRSRNSTAPEPQHRSRPMGPKPAIKPVPPLDSFGNFETVVPLTQILKRSLVTYTKIIYDDDLPPPPAAKKGRK